MTEDVWDKSVVILRLGQQWNEEDYIGLLFHLRHYLEFKPSAPTMATDRMTKQVVLNAESLNAVRSAYLLVLSNISTRQFRQNERELGFMGDSQAELCQNDWGIAHKGRSEPSQTKTNNLMNFYRRWDAYTETLTNRHSFALWWQNNRRKKPLTRCERIWFVGRLNVQLAVYLTTQCIFRCHARCPISFKWHYEKKLIFFILLMSDNEITTRHNCIIITVTKVLPDLSPS